MKKLLYLPVFFFLISFLFCQLPLSAQLKLTEQQKAGVETYIRKNPVLSKYSNDVRDKVLSDEENISNILKCWEPIKRYAEMENIRDNENLATIYSDLGQKFPDFRNKLLPDFNRTEYNNTMTLLAGNKININVTMHADLLKHYNSGRKDKLNSENAFGSMIIQWPELVENLRKAASAALNKEISDDLLNLWLEMNYFQKMRLDAIKEMGELEKDDYGYIEKGCLKHFPQQFEELANKIQETPGDWNGVFSNEIFTLNVSTRGSFVFGSYTIKVGNSSESAQWDLTPKGNTAMGKWNLVSIDDDKMITRTGDVTVTLTGDAFKYEIIEGDPVIAWKPNVKPYNLETTKGAKWYGTLTRKK